MNERADDDAGVRFMSGFVKLSSDMMHSSIWLERDQRDIFITALLMAMPRYFAEPVATIRMDSTAPDDFVVPPGDYGFVRSSAPGLIHATHVDMVAGMQALAALAAPDPASRSPEYAGRRMVRVSGGFIVLNYDRYRQKDDSAAERMRRLRERKKALRVTPRNVTQAEVEGEGTRQKAEASKEQTTGARALAKVPSQKKMTPQFETLWRAYPKHTHKRAAMAALDRLNPSIELFNRILESIEEHQLTPQWIDTYNNQHVPNLGRYLNERMWEDELV